MGEELITVGVTCYNAEKTIERCLNSVLEQDYKNIEICIVDDMSSDRSVEIINKFISENRNFNIVFIKNDINVGIGANRSKILNESKGKYIVFFDDDDVSHPGRLRIQYEHIKKIESEGYRNGVLCYASGDREYENGYRKELPAIASKGKLIEGEDLAAYLLAFEKKETNFYGSGTPTCSLMFDKANAIKNGGFDSSFRRVEDADFAINMTLKGAVVTGVEQKLFRQYATTSDDKSYLNNYLAEIKLIDKYKDFLEERNIYSYAKLWTKLRYLRYEKKYISFLITLVILILKNPLRTFKHAVKTFPKRIMHELKIKGILR